nr:two-component response regulator ARR22 [Ipomoea batatas]
MVGDGLRSGLRFAAGDGWLVDSDLEAMDDDGWPADSDLKAMDGSVNSILSLDLSLMDKEIPVKDGVNATRELREMGVKSMTIGVTSHGSGAVRNEFIGAGLD